MATKNALKTNTYDQPAPVLKKITDDSFHHTLELRYGSSFAQWIIDRMETAEQK